MTDKPHHSCKYTDDFILKIINEIRERKESILIIRNHGLNPTTFYQRARKLGFYAGIKDKKVNPAPCKTRRKLYPDEFIRRVHEEIRAGAPSYATIAKYNMRPATFYYRLRKIEEAEKKERRKKRIYF